MNRVLAILVSTALGLSLTGSARGAVRSVPADYATIQSAIDAAAPLDTILVSAGEYAESLVLSGKDLLMVGHAPFESVVVPPAGRAMTIGPGVTSATLIAGFTFRGGIAAAGGGVFLGNGSSCSFRFCLFESNVAASGTKADSRGGALCVTGGGTARMEHCQFVRNRTDFGPALSQGVGGGVFVGAGSSLIADKCHFRRNVAAGFEGGFGGAVAVDPGSESASFEDCVFDSNFAGYGGAIGGWGELQVRRCTFSSNQGVYGASAIYFQSHSSLSVERSVFFDNQSLFAPTLWWDAPGALRGNTFAYNRLDYGTATPIHGCIEIDPSRVVVANNIVARNDGWGIVGWAAPPLSGSVTCNDVWGNRDGDYGGTIPDLTGVDGNLSADPIFCDSTAWSFGIRPGSPCDDAQCGLIGAFPVGCPPTAVNPILGPGIELLLGSSNPGRPPFTIAFRLDGSVRVRLEIVDVAGRLVSRLEKGVLPAGRHERSWSGIGSGGRTAGPGIYFVRLLAGRTSLTRKIVALR